jgi:hypothetical protein
MWVYEHQVSEYDCHRSDPSRPRVPCQGRTCMAWRWGYVNKIDDPHYEGVSFSAEEIGIPEGKFPAKTRFRGRKGFCGLAGKPSE